MSQETSNNATRVWIQSSAIESIRNPVTPRFSKLNLKRSSTPSTISDSESDVGSLSGSVDMGRQSTYGWLLGDLLSNNTTGVAVLVEGQSYTLPNSALVNNLVALANEFPIDSNCKPIIPDDLITLTHLHEAEVVYCLQQRYLDDHIYTNTGQVLLALNPFSSIRGLYGETIMRKYSDRNPNTTTKLPPHVYQIADASFQSMMRVLEQNLGRTNTTTTTGTANQSILVSGESGAGKTVTTKLVMKYLAALSSRSAIVAPTKRAYQMVANARISPPKNFNRAPSPPDLPSTISSNSIESQVLESNPILESFGNARTVRNDNSSRFGKFIEIQFTESGQLVGATIDVYLLEKVRLLSQAEGERNYHVYYELLSGGMSANELRQFYLASTAGPEDFKMTQSGTYDRRDGVTDKETFKALKVAMNSMGFDAVEQKNIFTITAALLHSSNLDFQSLDDARSQLNIENIHLKPACMLLGVMPDELNAALCTFSIQAGRGEPVRRSQSKPRAEKGLEAFIKATYGALFIYLVRRINDSIAYKVSDEESSLATAPVATIGVLDIFGFESFATNSFEQLCINYCNEALQQQFNSFLLKNEQEEYEREGIEWSFIEFPENQDVLELIDKRGSGILNILDDQCRAPGTSDKSFASDLYNKCNAHARFQANRKQVAVLQFEVHHYAGPVEYSTLGFLEKNRDELPKEATELLRTSTNPFVQQLAETLMGSSPNVSAADGAALAPIPFHRSDSSIIVNTTVGGQFRRQLKDLRSKIDKTSPHYVRCLKPNDHLVPDHFDPVIVAEQLKCGGILEAVRVSRAGFTQHYPHSDFVRRYRCLAVKEIKNTSTQGGSNGRASWSGGEPCCSGVPPSPQSKWTSTQSRSFRGSRSILGTSSNLSTSQGQGKDVDNKEVCVDLLKVIYKKMQSFETEGCKGNIPDETTKEDTSPASKAKVNEYKSSTPVPAWSKVRTSASPSPSQCGLPPTPKSAPVKSRYQPWVKPQESSPPAASPAYRTPFRQAGSSDFAKVGIQIGKTKVFLRHKAFETLERVRSRHLTSTATKLNSVFRMYLSRMAFLPIRDDFREELRGQGFINSTNEHKDEHVGSNFSMVVMRSSNGVATFNLVEQFETLFRLGIHNPVKRKELGIPTKSFKWMLLEGLWVKNPIHIEEG